MIEVDPLVDKVIAIPDFEDLFDYLKHDSWRCEYPERYPDCCCGLDDLCDRLGLGRVPRPVVVER